MYQLKRTSFYGNYTLLRNGEEIFAFKHNKWRKKEARASYQGQQFSIKKPHVLASLHTLSKNGFEIGKMSFDWKMKASFQLYDPHVPDRMFSLKRTGALYSRFELVCTNPAISVLAFKPKMNWGKFAFNYQVEELTTEETWFDVHELMIFSIYAINRYSATMGSGT